jgi:hypothetical protein
MTSQNYLGNKNLKRVGVPVEFTQEQVKEYIKCSRDPIHFIRQYVKIVNVDEGLVNFEMWPFQEEMVQKFGDNRFVICKLPRQVGKTTTVAAYILWQVLFNEQYSVAILANKLAQAREILGRIQTAYEHLPKWLQQGVKEWNKGNIELENGSEILASATSSSAIRGTSQNLIYLDEFAFVPNNLQEEFFASVFPTVSSGTSTKVLITSTPNGMNMFYKIWVDSEEGNNDYIRQDVHWSDVPGRDEKWKEETIKNTSEEQFRQEFECEFLGSTSTLINGRKLAQIPFKKPIQSVNGFDIYEKPKPDHLYVITVDTSRGVGLDYSAFVVFDVTDIPYKIVGKYRSKDISPMFYPDVIVNAARMYNDAFLLIELNDLGETVATIAQQDLEYENVLTTSVKGRGGQQVGGGFAHRVQLGVKTTKTVKRIGCSNLKDIVENDKVILNDYDLLQELSVFINKRNSYEAEEGHHDDLVMCAVLFSWLVRQEFFIELTDNDVRNRLYLENQKMIEDDVLPFGIIDDGQDTLQQEDSYGSLGYQYSVEDTVDF